MPEPSAWDASPGTRRARGFQADWRPPHQHPGYHHACLSLSLTTPVTTRLSRSPSPSLPYPFLLSLLLSFSLSPSPPLPPQLTPPLWSPLRLARYAYRHAHRTAHPCYLVFCCPVHCLLFLSFSTSTLASSATFHHVFFLLFTLTDSLLACGFNSKRVVIPANYNKPMCTF